MTSAQRKLKPEQRSGVVVRPSLVRSQAAALIAEGNPHIHSAPLGENDGCVRVTQQKLESNQGHYPWAPLKPQVSLRLRDSKDRSQEIQSILDTLFSSQRSSVKENIRLIIEELTSNAMYHSIRSESGKDRYRRTQRISLKESEAVELTCDRSKDGAYIRVSDHGGTLTLDIIGKCLQRCYEKKGTDQLEKKEGGAGLGFFMIFENVTHMDVTVIPKVAATISVWLPLTGPTDSNYFSFNFWGKKHVTK